MRGRQGGRAARTSAAATAIALAALGAACKDRSAPPAASAGDAAPAVASGDGARPLSAACASALSGLGILAAGDRVAELVRACAPCDTAPILLERRGMKRTISYLADLDAAVAACGGFCTKRARTEFGRHVQAQLDSGEPSARPWRELAAACPEALGWREDSRGYLGATWFLLERIARAAEREQPGPRSVAEKAPFPLPAVASEGRGLELPSAPSAREAMKLPGRLVITVLAADVLVGRLPWAALSRSGVAVDGAYPGVSLAQSQGTLRGALETAEAQLASAPIAPQLQALPSAAPPVVSPATSASAPARTSAGRSPSTPAGPSPSTPAGPSGSASATPSATSSTTSSTASSTSSSTASGAPPSATVEDPSHLAAPPASHGAVELPLPSLAAPYGLPARRLVEVLTQLGRPARLLVQPPSPLPEYAPPQALAPILTTAGLANARPLALADTAALDAIAADPQGPAVPLVLQLGAETTVEEVALAAAKLHRHPILGLAMAPAAESAPVKPPRPPRPPRPPKP